jgi:hypothetical protein
MAKFLVKENIDDKIQIYFDHQGGISERRLREAFDEFMGGAAPELAARIADAPEFKDDKCVLPLQAADLIAWHIRRHIYEMQRGAELDTAIYSELLSLRGRHSIWNEERLQFLAQQMRQADPLLRGITMSLPDPSSGWGYAF